MQFHKIRIAFLIVLMVTILCAGLGYRAYFSRGGPDWAYWLGSSLLNLLMVLTGMIVSIGAATSHQFVQKLYSLKGSTKEISTTQRYIWILIGLLLIFIGTLLLINTLRFILSECPAPGC